MQDQIEGAAADQALDHRPSAVSADRRGLPHGLDPEIPVNIYDLGLVYTIEIGQENAVEITMTLTAPGCPVAGEMPGWVANAVEPLPGVKQVDVHMTFDPPWGMDMMSDEARLELGFM
jgi:FeS assembly SUF system protein